MSELSVGRLKSRETLMEGRKNIDAQIIFMTYVQGRKTNRTVVAGSFNEISLRISKFTLQF
jgi:hypothetical protein